MRAHDIPGMSKSGRATAALAACLVLCLTSMTPAAPSVELVRDGKPVATIVIPDVPKPPDAEARLRDGFPLSNLIVPAPDGFVHLAVAEFNRYLKMATGCELPVKTEKDAVDGPLVLIGESALTRALGVEESALPNEGYVVKTFPDRLVIVGDTTALLDGWYEYPVLGNVWAVLRVLEDALGCRWYHFEEDLGTVVPETKNVTVSMDVADAPVFPIRTARWTDRKTEAPHFLRIRLANGYGGLWANHTMGFQTKYYRDKHPEILAVEKNGEIKIKRPRRGGELIYNDYTSEKALELYIRDHIGWYEGDRPEIKKAWEKTGARDRHPNDFMMALAPNDGLVFSESPAALEILDLEGPWSGRASDYVHRFGQRWAKAMYERYPKKRVCILAYASYAYPPKRFREYPPNVIIQLAVMQPMALWTSDAVYDRWMNVAREWRDLTDNKVHFWQYACWPGIHAPIVWTGLWQRWYRECRDWSLGAFMNGSPPKKNYALHHVNLYFAARLLWNPDYDLDAGLREYGDKMYGPAGEDMYNFFHLVRRRWEDVDMDLPETARLPGPTDLYGEDGVFPVETVTRLRVFLDSAAARTDLTPIQRRRLEWVTEGCREFFKEAADYHNAVTPQNLSFQLERAPKIDGVPNDDEWMTAHRLAVENRMEDGERMDVASDLWTGWTDDAFYLAMVNREPRMNELVTREPEGGEVHKDDSVEFYLDVEGKRQRYHHVMINAAGAKLLTQGRVTGLPESWDAPGLEAKTRRFDDRWTVEVKVPFAALGVEPPPSRAWVWNVFRHRCAGEDTYLALTPTMNSLTRRFLTFPNLVLAPAPVFFEGFDQPATGVAAIYTFNTREKKRVRAGKGVVTRNEGGLHRFAFVVDAIPEAEWPHHGVVRAYTPIVKVDAVPVTENLAFESRCRLTAGLVYDIRLQGYVKNNAGERVHLNFRVFDGKATGDWQRLTQPLHGEQIGPKKSPTTLNESTRVIDLRLFVTVDPGLEAPGEVDYMALVERPDLAAAGDD